MKLKKFQKEIHFHGMFANEILSEIKQNPTEAEYLNDILEIGLEILS